jgi:Zn-dependent protease with chaperone function
VILAGAAMPLVASLLLAVAAAPVGRRLPPRTAVPLFAGAAVVVAATTGFVLAVVAFTVAGADAEVAAFGHWSGPVVARLAAIPTPIGVAAGAVSLLLVASTLRRLVVAERALWAAGAACRRLGAGVDGLVIVDDDRAEAYALPGLVGRIVVTRGMLTALTASERRVLFAHERSHLDHRHTLFVQFAELAAAANPLLRPVAAVVRGGVERWADEDAAAAVGDRALAARALARAAVATTGSQRSRTTRVAALAVTGSTVTVRARALLAPPPRPRRVLAAAILGCVLAAGAGAFVVEHSAEHTFERAGSVTSAR